MKPTSLGAAVAAALAGLGSLPGAWAQRSDTPLEEVIVTATRREVTVQDTPLAVTAINAGDLDLRNIENV